MRPASEYFRSGFPNTFRLKLITCTDLESSPGFSRAAWIVVAALIACILLPTVLHPFDLDQGIFDLNGRMLLEGRAYYRDMIDVKPPLLSFIYAGANLLFHAGHHSIRILDIILQGATCWLMIKLVRRGGGTDTMAATAAICYAILYAGQHYSSLAQTESYTGILGLGMIWLALFRRTIPGFLIIGVLGGLLWLLKFSLVGMLGAVMVAELAIARPSTKILLLHWLLMIAGWGIVVALFFLYLSINDAYYDFMLVAEWSRAYSMGYLSMPKKIFLKLIELAPMELIGRFSILIALGMVAGMALSLRKPPARERNVNDASTLLSISTLAFMFLLVTIVAEGKYFAYHFGRMFSFGAILGSTGILFALNRLARRTVVQRYTIFLGVLLLCGIVAFGPLINYGRNVLRPVAQLVRYSGTTRGLSFYDYASIEPPQVGDYIARHRRPGDKLFAAAGIGACIYYHTGFMPTTKINHLVYVTASYAQQPWKDSVRAYLLREPPRFIVSDLMNRAPSTFGNNMSSDEGLRALPGIDSLLRTSYMPTMHTRQLQVYERKK